MRYLPVLLWFGLTLGAQPQFVRVSGGDLIAPGGEKLLLRGINLGNWLVTEGYMFHFEDGPQSGREIDALFHDLIGPSATEKFWKEYRANYITEPDIQFIRKQGFNSVRIPFDYRVLEGNNFELLDRVVAWCRRAGLYVILDMHCAPGGQTGTNIDNSWGYPWLFESDDARRHTAALWRDIGRHYRDETAIIGYDLLNEPIPHFPPLRHLNPLLEPVYKEITAAIREVDKNHLVILGGAQWDSNFDVFGPPFDAKSMYTFHKYWTDPTVQVIQSYLDFRKRYNVPLWLGESGENKDEWIAKFRAVLEENNVGWAFWPYKKMDATSCMASFARPARWDKIISYAKLDGSVGTAEKRISQRPSNVESQAAMAELLKNIQFANCRINQEYIQALIPAKPDH